MKRDTIPGLLIAILLLNPALSQVSNNDTKQPEEELVANNMLLWQRNNGGWPKDTYNIFFDDSKTDIDNDINRDKTKAVKVPINYTIEQTPEQRKLALDSFQHSGIRSLEFT